MCEDGGLNMELNIKAECGSTDVKDLKSVERWAWYEDKYIHIFIDTINNKIYIDGMDCSNKPE